jgi:hypothetical protein
VSGWNPYVLGIVVVQMSECSCQLKQTRSDTIVLGTDAKKQEVIARRSNAHSPSKSSSKLPFILLFASAPIRVHRLPPPHQVFLLNAPWAVDRTKLEATPRAASMKPPSQTMQPIKTFTMSSSVCKTTTIFCVGRS